MIKLIPYNNKLISIGNENHYDDQLVYSDGNVAYGWHYVPQQINTAINRSTAGLWVCAETSDSGGNDIFILMDENLKFNKTAIRGINPDTNYYQYYCYPWVCNTWFDSTLYSNVGEMILDENTHYEFVGNIVRMNNNGEVLTYDSSPTQHRWLCKYSSDGSVIKTDLYPLLDEQYSGPRDWYRISAGEGAEHVRSLALTSLNCDGAYVTVETQNPDEPFIHFYCSGGVCTESAFPTHIDLSANAKLMLPSLDLIVDDVRYNNDPLKILDAKYTTFLTTNVNGVHAYKNIIISQFSDTTYNAGYLFKNGTLYDMFTWRDSDDITINPIHCWSLSEIPGGQWYVNYNP